MRSLVREAGLEHEIEIDSAGVGDWHAGDPPDRRATAAARTRGITLEGAARKVTRRDFEEFDLLLAADRANVHDLRAVAPAGTESKIRLLREFDPRPPARPTSTSPIRTTAAHTASRPCSTRSRPRAAACSMSFADAVRDATGRTVRDVERVSGGDINNAFRVQFEDESFAFVKTRADVAPGEYAAEAAALRWLGEPGALRVPEVLGVSELVLVLDWVDEGRRGDPAAFGAGLAAVHAAGAEAFGAVPSGAVGASSTDPALGAAGASPPLRIGPLTLPNDPAPDWPTFYAERRLRPLLDRARLAASGRPGRRARLREDRRPRRSTRASGASARRPVERQRPLGPPGPRLADRSRGLRRPPRGRPRDAAAVRRPGPHFFAAYDERFPRAPGHEERVPLYQLFPLLVHAALFGGGYAASVERAASVLRLKSDGRSTTPVRGRKYVRGIRASGP